MARYRGPRLKKCRTVGTVLPGLTTAATLDRPYGPGVHGQRRRGKPSDYKTRLVEKQKLRWHFGVLEKQFRRYYSTAFQKKGNTGETMLSLLENRLDNTVFRLGFAGSRSEARQLVAHGHFVVNGRRTDIPSYQMRKGDVIVVREKSRTVQRILDAMERAINRPQMSWLEMKKDEFAGTVLGWPVRSELTLPIQENLIVELYSR